jgi:hypothetical protein
MVDRQVGSDPPRPGAKVAVGAKPVPRTVDAPKSLHGQILGNAWVAHNTHGPGVDIALKLTYQRLERIDLAMREPLEQVHELLYLVLRDMNTQVTGFFGARQRRRSPLCDALKSCHIGIEHDYKDQIHDETARQSRSAFGIGLSIALLKFRFKFSKAPTKNRGLLVFMHVFGR